MTNKTEVKRYVLDYINFAVANDEIFGIECSPSYSKRLLGAVAMLESDSKIRDVKLFDGCRVARYIPEVLAKSVFK